MKIVCCDNFGRENRAEKLVASNITDKVLAEILVSALQDYPLKSDQDWYKLVEDDYVLWRGMEEFI